MTKRCTKCRKPMEAERFICPHCGAIYGAPVYHYKHARKHKTISPKTLRAVLASVLMILLVMLAWKPLLEWFFPETLPDDGNAVIDDITSYCVKVVDQNEKPINGAVVEFSSENLANSILTETDKSGIAYIFLHRDNTVRAEVIGWPTDIDCFAPDPVIFGSDNYRIVTLHTYHLGGLPTTVTSSQTQQREIKVTVLDTLGTPVPGVELVAGQFNISFSQRSVSDENGCCTFLLAGGCNVRLNMLPEGYYSDWQTYPVDDSQTELTVIVYGKEDVPAQEGKAVYTVALRMENGNAIKKRLCNAGIFA